MSVIKHPDEIDKLYYNDEISKSEAFKLRNAWEKSTEEEKKENAIYTKSLENEAKKEDAKTYNKISDLSEKEILTEILKVNRKTSGWITFIGWVVLIGIAFNIIMALGFLSL